MSLNDFESLDDFILSEEAINQEPQVATYTLTGVKSDIGKSTGRALKAKQELQYAISEAVDASTDFGYELGKIDERERILGIMQTYGDVLGPTKDTLIALIEDERF